MEGRGADSKGHGTGQSLQVRRQRKISSGSKCDSERYPIDDFKSQYKISPKIEGHNEFRVKCNFNVNQCRYLVIVLTRLGEPIDSIV